MRTSAITSIPAHAGLAIDAGSIGHVYPDGRRVLEDVELSIRPGQIVAIVGASGAGKSTLLDALAGVRPPSEGVVRFDGVDATEHRRAFRSAIGYVPQDDIIHRDLPLRSTLRYAARLRLPATTSRDEIDATVDRTLAALDLLDHAGVRVGDLSGGQRKRASIGAELLTRPRGFFLDEPTSGLDPSTALGLMRTLRSLADTGTTIVLTTHSTADLRQCDEVVFLARGGHVAFRGTVEDAMEHYDTSDVAEIYEIVAGELEPGPWARRRAAASATVRHAPEQRSSEPPAERAAPLAPAAEEPAAGPRIAVATRSLRQWAVLSQRSLDVLVRNRLTLAITFGSPALVVAMFLVLFEPGAFDPGDPDPTAAVMIAFWTAFAGFFFGLTFGLLQICTEISIFRRERFVGLGIGPYLLSKLAVLVPLLVVVTGIMLGALGAFDRLPSMSARATAALAVTVLLDAVAAVALGLLASAAVNDPAHATLALPMLCFPAVLFSGAILPVGAMAAPGELLSIVTSDRWAFEAIGRQLGLGSMQVMAGSRNVLRPYGDAFGDGAVGHWLTLSVFAAVFLVGAARVLSRRTTPVARRA